MGAKISNIVKNLRADPVTAIKYYWVRLFIVRCVINKSYDEYYDWEKSHDFLMQKMMFKLTHGYHLNLTCPKSFSEKLVHRRIFCRDKIWPIATNKISVREWIVENGLDRYVKLIPVVAQFENPDEVGETNCVAPCVIKAAWASGYNIFIKENATDFSQISKRLEAWAKAPYAIDRLIWAPHQMPRHFIVEKMLLDAEGEPPEDFKFYVFNGKVELIQVHISRFKSHCHAYFNGNLERVNVSRGKPVAHGYQLPREIDKLITAAEKIGKHFDFARIDLYLHRSDVYFGEITQTPANGTIPFRPIEFDFELGRKWQYQISECQDGVPQ